MCYVSENTTKREVKVQILLLPAHATMIKIFFFFWEKNKTSEIALHKPPVWTLKILKVVQKKSYFMNIFPV